MSQLKQCPHCAANISAERLICPLCNKPAQAVMPITLAHKVAAFVVLAALVTVFVELKPYFFTPSGIDWSLGAETTPAVQMPFAGPPTQPGDAPAPAPKTALHAMKVNLLDMIGKTPRSVAKQLPGAQVSDTYADDAEDVDSPLYMAKVIAYDLPDGDDLMVSYAYGKARKVTLDNQNGDQGLGFFEIDAPNHLPACGLHVAQLADDYKVKGALWRNVDPGGCEVTLDSYDSGTVRQIQVQNFDE